jgi:putative transposase
LLYQACEVNQWWIHEIKILPDHVHLLIQIQPRNSLAYTMHILQGGTSKKLREEFPALEEFLWGDSFWSDGYFAESVGAFSESTVRKYIKDQASSMPVNPRSPAL